MKVAFQGEHGAYSEMAAIKYFKMQIETLPCKTFADVFASVSTGNCDFGIIPIENSIEGSVGQNYDLLSKTNLNICGETILKVQHCLIANPKSKLRDIRRVYSHPQALGQCRTFIEKNRLEEVPVYDTAGSVKLVKDSKRLDCAGIASALAAKIYNMKILKENIETNDNNFTRFLVLSKKIYKTKNDKTTIMFRIKHEPGSLYSALRTFSSNGINLTKLESRPMVGKPWEYQFYLDLEGDSSKPEVKRAIMELKERSDSLLVIGSYPKAGGTFSIDEKQTAKKRTVFDNKTVAIIGASGGMGKWFCRLFASEGINVIASGRNQDKINKLSSELGIKAAKSNIDAVKNSDFVLISVLLDDFYGVVKEIAPFTRGKIVIDVTSAKEAPVKTMHELLKGSVVLGTHPLFGPKAEDTNQNFVLTPTNSVENKLAKQFSEWLEDVGFHVSIMRPEKHDRIMAVALTLSHFIGIAAGETWMEFNFEELRNATPSSFKRLLGLVENIADSDPNFYANLQMILPHVSDIEGKFIDNARRLYLIVKNKDEVGFAREMKKLSKSIDKYK